MKPLKPQLESQINSGAVRLVSRAGEIYGVSIEAITDRIRHGVEKYLLTGDIEPSPQQLSEFIDTLHAGDLCLVIACECGIDDAWSDLMARFGSTVRSAARSVAGSEDAADDLSQSIWAELHGLRIRDGKPKGKIGYYSGRGSLGGWLRAVVGQLAVDQYRKVSRLVQAEEEKDLDRFSNIAEESDDFSVTRSSAQDPESAFISERSSESVESALSTALATLEAEDRLLVKLYYFDGLKLKEAGAVLGVHEATASRRLNRIQIDIRKQVEDLLIKRHGWKPDEVRQELSRAALLLQSDVEAMLAGHSSTQETA